ncbi:permease [Halococcus thailandensis JCM 13552]|uniref:Permease n=1 Tax=Halococcus thailandensis JCM 13552 TaxID=1227457 RepID=M0NGJ8_9EURY|nr:permease [Halococcus thailandensis]EMA56678.1 permease [Halococcus thailandensis JCM 13552]
MVIGVLIHGVVPVDVLQTVLGSENPLAVPLAALAGAPIYVSLSGMLPIAASLSEQGIAIGTVLAFVVGGAGVSIPNVILLNKLFKRRLLIVYATTVVAIGVVVGVVFNVFIV